MQRATRRKLERLRAALHTSMLRCAWAHWQATASGPDGCEDWKRSTGNPTISELLEQDRSARYSSPGGRRRALRIMKRLQSVRHCACRQPLPMHMPSVVAAGWPSPSDSRPADKRRCYSTSEAQTACWPQRSTSGVRRRDGFQLSGRSCDLPAPTHRQMTQRPRGSSARHGPKPTSAPPQGRRRRRRGPCGAIAAAACSRRPPPQRPPPHARPPPFRRRRRIARTRARQRRRYRPGRTSCLSPPRSCRA